MNDPFLQRQETPTAIAQVAPPPPVVKETASVELREHDSIDAPDANVQLASGSAYNGGAVQTASAILPLRRSRCVGGCPAESGCQYGATSCPTYALSSADEVLCDGGDEQLPAAVRRDGGVWGVEPEDAIAHYNTIDDRTIVVPTNKVCIYAPRFGSVRRLTGASIDVGRRMADGVATDLTLVQTNADVNANTATQRKAPVGAAKDLPPSQFRRRELQGGLANEQGIARASQRQFPLVDLQRTRGVQVDNRDRAAVAVGMLNAIAWTYDVGVQVVIDERRAQVVASDQQTAIIYKLDEPHQPRLKVIKLADRATAQPGETVRFSLSFENVGNRPLDKVTLIDNLTTRLEYVDGSQQSDRAADFASTSNDAGSLILRWELRQPLEPGDQGTITFQCRVR